MNSQIASSLIGKHVTLITTPSNQPVTPESTAILFSGVVAGIDACMIILRLQDGTRGLYYEDKIIGYVENKVIGPSSDIDNSKRMENAKENLP